MPEIEVKAGDSVVLLPGHDIKLPVVSSAPSDFRALVTLPVSGQSFKILRGSPVDTVDGVLSDATVVSEFPGQLLVISINSSRTGYDLSLTTAAEGDSLPEGGEEGDILTLGSEGPKWTAMPEALPSTENAEQGDVLVLGEEGPKWAAPQGLPDSSEANEGNALLVGEGGELIWDAVAPFGLPYVIVHNDFGALPNSVSLIEGTAYNNNNYLALFVEGNTLRVDLLKDVLITSSGNALNDGGPDDEVDRLVVTGPNGFLDYSLLRGAQGKGISLSGAANSGAFVIDHSDLQVTGDIMIECWYYHYPKASSGTILFRGDENGNITYSLSNDFAQAITFKRANVSESQELTVTFIALSHGWNHVAVGHIVNSNQVRCFINGALVEIESVDPITVPAVDGYPTYLFRDYDDNESARLIGSVAHVVLRDAVLTPLQVKTAMRRGPQYSEPSTIKAYWPCTGLGDVVAIYLNEVKAAHIGTFAGGSVAVFNDHLTPPPYFGG